MNIKTFNLTNKNGITMTVTNLGCAIISLHVPDKNGKTRDIVLGLDSAEDYATKPHPSFGAVCGRVANLVENARFTLDGKEYVLEANSHPNHIHGGTGGFDRRPWTVEEATESKLVFSLFSPDGDNGYPGNLTVYCTYRLTDDNKLRMDFRGETDTKTVCNLTNHTYFNLDGHDAADVYGHKLQILADQYTPTDERYLPTGEFRDVAGTPFDFRMAKLIGQDFHAAGKDGYVHNFVLREPGVAAIAYSPVSGIRMTTRTNSPGVLLYTSDCLDGSLRGKGVAYQKFCAFCLETQLFPGTLNRPGFPSAIVTADTPQEFYTEFEFEW